MTRDDVIRMAREAGFEELFKDSHDWVCFTEEIERFAAFIAAAEQKKWEDQTQVEIHEAVLEEREECAKVCDELAGLLFCHGDKSGAEIAISLRDAIRARGQA